MPGGRQARRWQGGDGAASEASEWENREREEQLALLREEELRGEAGGGGLGG